MRRMRWIAHEVKPRGRRRVVAREMDIARSAADIQHVALFEAIGGSVACNGAAPTDVQDAELAPLREELSPERRRRREREWGVERNCSAEHDAIKIDVT